MRRLFFLLLGWIMVEAQPHGSWTSPITSDLIVEKSLRLGNIVLDGDTLYWNELRPEEKGRSVVVKWENGKGVDCTFDPYNVRTRVHEYGGLCFTVHGGVIDFSNFKDQGFYRRDLEGKVEKLWGDENHRTANPVYDPSRDVIFAVGEEHAEEVVNHLIRIGKETKVIHEGHDFYSMPTLHPKGTHIAFLTWDHPNMPWDGTTLWLGELDSEGNITSVEKVAGGENESIFEPRFSPAGDLYFVSERSGFWNLYKVEGKEAKAVCPMEAEFGQPLWVFGMSNYGFLKDGRIACVYTKKGTDFFGILDPESGKLETIDLPFTSYGSFVAQGNAVFFTAASPTLPSALMKYSPDGTLEVIRKSKECLIDTGYISIPETIEFPTAGEKNSFAFYYPPKNKDFEGTDLPPLIVKSHGGPTARCSSALNLEIQFWTSRGFGVLDVNYGGSTGFGKEYRERLKGNWGIVDVDDCVYGALFLADQGRVDRKRMAIKGGSAGGYTTLAALAFREVFKAGASYYGVSDLEALCKGTHKFESRYNDTLVGPYPEAKELYMDRSPIHHVENLSCPVILLQGSEDKIVPPDQSEMMYEALKKKGIPVSYILFEGEQHGFRISENVKKALESELYFYGKIFGFTPHDPLEPVEIDNL